METYLIHQKTHYLSINNIPLYKHTFHFASSLYDAKCILKDLKATERYKSTYSKKLIDAQAIRKLFKTIYIGKHKSISNNVEYNYYSIYGEMNFVDEHTGKNYWFEQQVNLEIGAELEIIIKEVKS
ncbi:MAG: hypothetical protein WC979_03185 [Candidatus Pacearchaeota archaeon]|jgi:hypothetical protein|nr:hypothetical protein [Clostridia bacterium]